MNVRASAESGYRRQRMWMIPTPMNQYNMTVNPLSALRWMCGVSICYLSTCDLALNLVRVLQ